MGKSWFACKNEEIKLVWSLFNPDKVVVTATPSNAFNPLFENKTLRDNGEMLLTFLAQQLLR